MQLSGEVRFLDDLSLSLLNGKGLLTLRHEVTLARGSETHSLDKKQKCEEKARPWFNNNMLNLVATTFSNSCTPQRDRTSFVRARQRA
jgi:hypothetical protein